MRYAGNSTIGWPGMVSVYVTGPSPITWLEVRDPTEALEIYPDRALADRLAEGTLLNSGEIRPSFAEPDGVVFAVASRLRQAHLDAGALTDIEASTLAHLLVRHLLYRYGTGRASPGRPAGQLRPGAVDVVAEHRLMVARDRLLRGDVSVAGIALSVGFCNISHFRRLFRRRYGLAPAGLRRASATGRQGMSP